MKLINNQLAIVLCLSFLLFFPFLSIAFPSEFPRGKYPSAILKISLPGLWENPTDPQTILEFIQMYGTSSAEMVKRWELDNNDLFIGADYGKEENEKRLVLGYCYPHLMLQTALGAIDYLKRWAIRNNVNYEDFNLHFREDTIINSSNIKSWINFWNGLIGAGSTDRSNSYGSTLGMNSDVFRGVNNDGAFFVWAIEPFTDIYISLERNGIGGKNMIIEYPSQVDEEFKIIQWKKAEIIEDTTNNFSQSGLIRIKYPPDWKYGRTYPPTAFYQAVFVNEKIGSYFLRIKVFDFATRPLVSSVRTTPSIQLIDGEEYVGVVNSGFIQFSTPTTTKISENASTSTDAYANFLIKIVNGKGKGQSRVILSYSPSEKTVSVDRPWEIVPDNTSEYRIVRRVIFIRGWDSRNDRNGDGWVDDNEFANLVSPKATARLKYQSRVIYGGGWVESSGDNGVNVWNPFYHQAIGEMYRDSWARSGLKGCYLDNLTQNNLGDNFKEMYGAIDPVILKGGYLIEYEEGRADQEFPTGQAWLDGYKNLLRKLKEITGSRWIGGNIANSNPFSNRYLIHLNEVMDWYTCEDTLHNGWAVNGWGGLGLRPGWIYPALAAKGIPHALSAHVRHIPSDRNTREMWERRLTELLSLYYLVQIPGKTAVEFWNSSFWYGSGNTVYRNINPTGRDGFWKAGVPRNYAYRPHGLLIRDIGI
ncbi:MAG: hypothetical protein NZ822_02845, partial [Patescibacteria group bacterium]|nr:hypothetical protein [Patescibacteria group bacterium]